MGEIQCVAFCPHCGNTAPQSQRGQTTLYLSDDFNRTYWLASCSTCNEAILYRHDYYEEPFGPDSGGDYFHRPERFSLVWPAKGELHAAVPDRIKEIYREAARIKKLSANGFANQIRRALEAVCKDQGETKGSLADKLKELATKNKIPPVLTEMTEIIRRLGNRGSHDDEDVESQYVEPMDEFFRAVVEYVYIAPEKLKAVKTTLDAAIAPNP